jgi:HlyD family secretion protein
MSMARIGGRKEDIQIARANVAKSEGNVRRLQTQIDQTVIHSPVDGLVTRRDVHLGDISTAGKIMFLMARDNRLELKAQVPETDLRFVKAGNDVTIDSSFVGQKEVNGKVRVISPLVDSDSRLATVRIDVPADCGLKPGMYAEGKINIGKLMALTVPSKAVVSRDEKHTVFVLHKDIVESRQIAIGNRNSDFVQISSGLNADESVVIDGAGFLKDGDRVAVASQAGSR